jgi:group II intron reverse transcriptase/maturase
LRILGYIQRWLEAPIEDQEGNRKYREGKGTPQGGVISPLLANLFLHYTFDKWMLLNLQGLKFVRYADDVIIHCKSHKQADYVLWKVKNRFQQCQLEVHEQKTKIVYCKKERSRLNYPEIKFDFLGFTFKPRTTAARDGKLFISTDCAISQKRLVKIIRELRISGLHRKTGRTLTQIAKEYNAKIRGWINYYGKFRWYELKSLFKRFNFRLIKWATNRYKRFKKSRVKAARWLREISSSYMGLFYHWKYPIFRTA